ncbi:hypothetical protein VOLCADRAFT_107339 [Volvox carteri f. nagariensis]|uniref:Threonylcarbamoyl-AMP synthase n=1 Tax=Volvox carteri f. nagariensis TaxID=3068 RepID=D8UDD7_VOLCA|nr:uncharacterized protein VOLCADRAFT_107339 [Volvox carteri f. nagariensis]EFJ42293.1 hypothetical protein VOLCADRAFT_107339 [Volvox carteri f. nagariensis]|eukprot:XP_002956691.1 hypothetical protein VOLCADRAFT_107339 [Volvox carteri f. nagariensis]
MLQGHVPFTSTFGHRRFFLHKPSPRGALTVVAYQKLQKRLKYAGTRKRNSPLILTVEPDGSDAWRLEQIVDLLKNGAVGVIPTDTLPAIVCDLHNKDAVQRLYTVKEMDAKKPLSCLVPNLSAVTQYTTGFPASNTPGSPNWFNVVRRLVPGPTILEGVGGVLLCTSVHVPEVLSEDTEVPDVGSILEAYGNKGIDFVVDVGRRVVVESSVVDFTGGDPVVLRHGQGDVSVFE